MLYAWAKESLYIDNNDRSFPVVTLGLNFDFCQGHIQALSNLAAQVFGDVVYETAQVVCMNML